MTDQQPLIDAVNDLARVMLACNEKITSKPDAVRRLKLVEMKPSRIASLLSIPSKSVRSQISKMKRAKRVKANGGGKGKRRG